MGFYFLSILHRSHTVSDLFNTFRFNPHLLILSILNAWLHNQILQFRNNIKLSFKLQTIEISFYEILQLGAHNILKFPKYYRSCKLTQTTEEESDYQENSGGKNQVQLNQFWF